MVGAPYTIVLLFCRPICNLVKHRNLLLLAYLICESSLAQPTASKDTTNLNLHVQAYNTGLFPKSHSQITKVSCEPDKRLYHWVNLREG